MEKVLAEGCPVGFLYKRQSVDPVSNFRRIPSGFKAFGEQNPSRRPARTVGLIYSPQEK